MLGKIVKDNERGIVLSKQTTLFYRILDNNDIELMSFWNNKWNPADLEHLLDM